MNDVLLVGSVPFNDAEEVMRTCGSVLGDFAFALPDGETGERSTWISALPHMTYVHNQDLTMVNAVAREDVASPDGHNEDLLESSLATFRLAAGVQRTEFELHFTEPALASYETFQSLKAERLIPQHLRFQISLPCTFDGIHLFFPEQRDRAIVNAAYERAIRRVLDAVLGVVPANELAVQWDFCLEILDILGWTDEYVPWTVPASAEERFAQHTAPEYLRAMSGGLPDEVLMGYHLCYGTWGGWPNAGVPDIDLAVRLANALAANSPHRVDFVHLPSMPEPDAEFFTPLGKLDIGAARPFLGIEAGDGVDALLRRAKLARKYLDNFGIAHYCGYGRDEPQRVRELLTDLRTGAERLAGAR